MLCNLMLQYIYCISIALAVGHAQHGYTLKKKKKLNYKMCLVKEK